CIKVVLPPAIIDPRVDVVLAEVLIAPEEEVVAVENVIRRPVRQRVRVENCEPVLIEPALSQRAGPDQSLRICEGRKLCALKNGPGPYPSGIEWVVDPDRHRPSANIDKSVAEIALPLICRRHRQQVIIASVEA